MPLTVPWPPTGWATTTSAPGATTSTYEPTWDCANVEPSSAIAPTPRTRGTRPGTSAGRHLVALWSLPTAATTTTSGATASAIAASTRSSDWRITSEMLMTWARPAAHWIASAKVAGVAAPEPSGPRSLTRIGKILASGASP